MNIDRKILKHAESIHKSRYRSFFTNKKSVYGQGIMMFTAYPLMIETEKYYNGELLSTYAIFKALRDFNNKYRVTAYYFENLIFRIISFWEYLYQFLNMHFQLGLYDDSAKRRIIEISGYKPELIPTGQGTRVEYVPLPKKEQKEIRNKLGKRLQIINKKNIVRYITGLYEVKDSLEVLLRIISNNNVEIIKNIRNQIIHQRPAGASFTINFDDSFFNTYTVSINNSGWIEFEKFDAEIQKCMNLIGEAIQVVHNIVHLNEYPNRIENAGIEYFLKKVQCNSCEEKYIAPSLLIGDADEYAEVIICPLCGNLGGSVFDTIKTTEVDYGTRLGEYLRSIKELRVEN
ncbi:hypothetical protein ACF3MZ_17700 [Paenibacillaceae bacterium WGS1546]|uniref:hypothetical protein n=1 Tax=Cohnella sp. WGS1546 TaxID=3366810 RepID=UPI00372D76A0